MMESLFTGVSGMSANARAIDVIANNIANVNTAGFKKSKVFFKDVFYKTLKYATPPSATTTLGGQNPMQSGLGTAISAIDPVFTQGTLETTGIQSNMALVGEGFFVISDFPGNKLYTRDGSFSLDANNQLVNGTGMYLRGWPAVKDPTTGELEIDTNTPIDRLTIPIGQLSKARATGVLECGGNLDASTPVSDPATDPASYTTSIVTYDSLGKSHTLYFDFWKLDPTVGPPPTNPWTWQPRADAADPDILSVAPAAGSGDVAYDANGQFLGTNPAQNVIITYQPGTGIDTPQTAVFDLTKTTQLDTTDVGGVPNSTLTVQHQNGFPMGTLSNYGIGSDGVITGIYSNGITEALGAVAVATFRNPPGLVQEGNNQFSESGNSGPALIGLAQTGPRGLINAGSVENSNVDIADEFVKLIVTQRAFQANTRVITTSDEMLQEVLQLKRSLPTQRP